MHDLQIARLERLKKQLDERCQCERELELLREQYIAAEPDQRLGIAHELIEKGECLLSLKEREDPTDVVEVFLLVLLESLHRLGVRHNPDLASERMSFETFKELAFQEVYVQKALDAVKSVSLADMELCHFSNFSLSLIEIGKRLPILSSVDGQDSGFSDLLEFSTYQDIQQLLYRREIGFRTKQTTHKTSNEYKQLAREAAKKLWRKDPSITIEDMIGRDEIHLCFNGKTYTDRTLRNWIKDLCPNRKPGRRPTRR